MRKDQEYVSSVTLLILGENLDPDVVSRELDLVPSQSWSKGVQHSYSLSDGTGRCFNSRHEWGGWKLNLNSSYNDAPIETQLNFWCDTLSDKSSVLAKLKEKGMYCALRLFVTTDNTASIVLSEKLQGALSALGLEIELSIVAGIRSEPDG